VIGVQDFWEAKNYKPTWTKTSLRLVFVLRWNEDFDQKFLNTS
jgi:hypothetical protein